VVAEEEEEPEEGQLALPPAEEVGDAPAEAEAGEGDNDDEEGQSVAAREDAHRDDGEAPPAPFSVPSGWRVVDEKPGNVLPRTLIPDGVGARIMTSIVHIVELGSVGLVCGSGCMPLQRQVQGRGELHRVVQRHTDQRVPHVCGRDPCVGCRCPHSPGGGVGDRATSRRLRLGCRRCRVSCARSAPKFL
jgi:hypothetical protein